ncbi:LCP family protein [Lihuaxuella thermophila]|uniref:Cell envelope-related function transcriptional attenuator common domain-containing protein n=1 Tax=Lihuaxuella thermophila TaxID=1173111 RepID=A0A1H8BAT7_9BACL|nr:LCP family protein [Lihuaxuella thermophila]SEM78947.1 cell envelope-related function transcriptional attenuator common domain-containing protein [Lihuaxuella thermophila]
MSPKRSAKRLWFRVFTLILLIGLLVVSYFGYRIWLTATRIYEPPTLTKSEKREKAVSITKDAVSLLLLGVDERTGDLGRSDTIVIATLNPMKKTVILTNIPRDTLVDIPGQTEKNKINHSYAYGGVELTRKTVERFLDIPIDGYVKVNMQGLEKIVDQLGGIEVMVPFDFSYGGYRFHQGKMTLNGKQALAFARMRKADPHGDFGRIRRQQEVLRGLIQKGTQFGSIMKLDQLLDELGNHMKTDIPPLRLFHLQRAYAGIRNEDISTVSFQGEDRTLDGTYYFIVSDEEINRVRRILTQHIGMESKTTGNPSQP